MMFRNISHYCQRVILPFLVLSLAFSCSHYYEPDTLDLTFYQWNLWPDREAERENDSLYLPPVDLSRLPLKLRSPKEPNLYELIIEWHGEDLSHTGTGRKTGKHCERTGTT